MIKNMRLVFKSLVFFFCIMTSCLNAKESFINEAKDLFKKKIMKKLNFYFKEILFLIQRTPSLMFI